MWGYIIAGIIALSLMATVAIKVKSHLDDVKESGRVEVRAEWLEASEKRRQRERANITAATKGLQDDRAARKTKVKTIITQVEKIIEKPIYRNVCLDPDGLRCVNAALGGARGDGCNTGGAMPRLGTTLRWEWSLGAAKVH